MFFTELQTIWESLDHHCRVYLLTYFQNAPRRPPPRRCINFDDSAFINDLPFSPIKIIFDSDDSDVSDDSGVIVISSDEFEEENEDISDDCDADGMMGILTTIIQLIDHHHLPLLKDKGYFECTTHDVVYVYTSSM